MQLVSSCITWFSLQVYVTSSTLDGECKELKAEDGDEDQSRQLTACAAWVQDHEEDAGELEDFVVAQVGNRSYKCTIIIFLLLLISQMKLKYYDKGQ